MRNEHTIAVIIPVLNEASSIGKVIDAIPTWVDDIVVVDNGSSDGTDDVAAGQGARVVVEPQRGYGAACLRGIAALDNPDIVVFLDGDYSDHPEEMPLLVDPIIQGEVDMMIGSRVRGERAPGALTPQARFGNVLATRLIRFFWGIRYTDLGPFRAIRYRTLLQLEMRDQDYGWTVEMQIKAALHAVPADEVPVSYRKRVGRSKVSGTVRGVLGAAYKILGTIFLSALFARPVLKTDLLVFFTRYPEPGTTKTRLIPALGPEGAAALQRAMTEHALSVAPPLEASVDVCVQYTGADRATMARWLGPRWLYAPQGDGDLGARMAAVFGDGFQQAYGKVVIAGTDCPSLDNRLTSRAFAALGDHDLVLGPALDGGYYLIGMNLYTAPEELDSFLGEMPWGASTVLEETRRRAAEHSLRVFELPERSDVDLPEDLAEWERASAENSISVIVPVFNEADQLEELLGQLERLNLGEVILVDGGSTDETVARARAWGLPVVASERGRGKQMNAGAAAATGSRFLFLHADTQLPRDAATWIRRALAFDEVAVGAFELRIDGNGFAYRWIAWAANLRSRRLDTPYGDQALFMRRGVFEQLAGFREIPIAEDYDLVRRARALGQIVTVPVPARTSSRRWRKEGCLRLTAKNVLTFFALPLGLSPHRIARWYGRGR